MTPRHARVGLAGGAVKEPAERIMADVSFDQEAGAQTGGGNQESFPWPTQARTYNTCHRRWREAQPDGER